MEEKVLIRGIITKRLPLFSFLPSVILFVVGFILMELATQVFSKSHYYDFEWELCGNLSVIFYIFAAIAFLIGMIFALGWSKSNFTVTSTRVYGIASFGKRVDLPLDSISAVGISFLKGIDVGTSSGQIHFKCITNNEEIHSILSKLLIERQQNQKSEILQNNILSNADELKKFKELLDNGVITQEEFNVKKKQLLGL